MHCPWWDDAFVSSFLYDLLILWEADVDFVTDTQCGNRRKNWSIKRNRKVVHAQSLAVRVSSNTMSWEGQSRSGKAITADCYSNSVTGRSCLRALETDDSETFSLPVCWQQRRCCTNGVINNAFDIITNVISPTTTDPPPYRPGDAACWLADGDKPSGYRHPRSEIPRSSDFSG